MTALTPETQKALVEALTNMAAFGRDWLEWTGGCDHDVGICYCDDIRRIETAEIVANRARAEMGEG